MTGVLLAGLGTRPLSRYLATVGLHRIIAEQLAPQARMTWVSDGPVLSDGPDRAELGEFLLDHYAPTPLVAPWNDKDQGGFQPGADGRSAKLLSAITAATSDRLRTYQETVRTVRNLVASSTWQQLAASSDGKHRLVTLLRNRVPESVVRFIDASVALTSDGPAYPPLLGTGANIGRLNLVTNYLEHLIRLMGENAAPEARRATWLAELLDGHPTDGVKGSPGQYDGHGVAAMNMVRVGKALERINPWTFVLSMEGAISFSASATVRLGTAQRAVAAPYMVRATAAGYGSAVAGETGKGEFWAPIWAGSVVWPELDTLIAEGRCLWRGKQAVSGLDLIRAAKTRGIDRGIGSFERYAIVERNGQSPIAVHLAAVPVSVNDTPAVRSTGELDGWLRAISRGANPPARIASLRRRVDRAIYQLSEQPRSAEARSLLVLVFEAERAAVRSRTFLESTRVFAVPRLGRSWPALLDDGSAEFAVASRLAAGWEPDARAKHRCLADLLRPVRRDGLDPVLDPDGPVVPGLGERPLYDVLAEVMAVRALTGPAPQADEIDTAVRGRWVQFPIVQPAAVRAEQCWVEELATGSLDERLLAEHLAACLLIDPRALGSYRPTAKPTPVEPSPMWRLLAPWFSRVHKPLKPFTTQDDAQPDSESAKLVPVVPATWPTRLRYARPGRTEALVREVASAYRAAGIELSGSPAHITLPPDPAAGRRVLSALLVPTRVGQLRRLITASTEPSKETTHAQ